METRKKGWKKGILISVAALFVGAAALNGWALNQEEDKTELLVTVEEVEITRGDVDHRIDTLLGARAGTLPPEQLASIRNSLDNRVLENMIIETLLTKAANEREITLDEKEVNKVVEDLKASLPPETGFADYLKGIGFTEDELVRTIKKDLKIRKLLETRLAGLQIPADQEIQQFYKDNKDQFTTPEGKEVRHILISVTPEDDAATQKEKLAKAEEIRGRLVEKKDDFAETAKTASDCPSKANGGNIGVVTKGSTVKPFEEAVFSQKVGEIGPIVKTRFGYHIIEVLKEQKEGTVPLAEVKASIADHLISKKKEETLKAYIDSLKSKAKIVYHHNKTAPANPA